MNQLSIIIPTMNEADNIEPLLSRIFKVVSYPMEVIVVDDGSTDGTRERVLDWQSKFPVRLLARDDEKGLAGAVAAGAKLARGDIVVVMDADLSHPPEAINRLVEPIIDGAFDFVVASRYAQGGSTPGWPLSRRICSRFATLLAWPLTDVRDPMSGFFAIRRERIMALQSHVAGFKVGLELIVQGGDSIRVAEIPIEFHDRRSGASKFSLHVMLAYLRQLMTLSGGNLSMVSGVRFGLVGLLGVITDLSLFHVLSSNGLGLGVAHIMSFLAATLVNYILNARWSFPRNNRAISHADRRRQYLAFLTVALLALFLRGGILAVLIELFALPAQAAILVAIGAAAVVNYLGSAFLVFPRRGVGLCRDVRWRVLTLGVFGYLLLLRVVYLGMPELLREEAYYWNYAQHLNIGYLDHPPMVAWIIWISTTLMGDSEFSIRIGAFFCWLITAFFSFKLTRNLFDKSTAFRAVLLLSTLPFFFCTGLVMTPDAPLVACWAGAIYFLERAMIGERRLAWWGVGVCIGLGMLSKYTIALLCPATLLFLLLDTRARRWLSAPEPYAAILLAIFLFLPVIIWNANHNWASFVFQGTRRLHHSFNFSLHELVGSVVLLLTPTGILTVLSMVLSKRAIKRGHNRTQETSERRKNKFASILTLLPLSVFVIFSLARAAKVHWTGPAWLVMIPFMAMYMAKEGNPDNRRFPGCVHRAWPATIVTLLLIYGAMLHYLVLGLPGLPYYGRNPLVGWRYLGRQVSMIEDAIEERTGREPLVVGMDKYRIASELAFYRTKAADDLRDQLSNEGVLYTAGPHLFGKNSLMYDYWYPAHNYKNTDMILVSDKIGDLVDSHVLSHFRKAGKVEEIVVRKNGLSVSRYYYRFVEGYSRLRGKVASGSI
ncbi:MAG: glycosyltransferase family 39 protein [Thermodesulfobacteriota bacterium]|nr:glycosyltransferase family 39 protein [Thermodesulfobacteriota bacterium]